MHYMEYSILSLSLCFCFYYFDESINQNGYLLFDSIVARGGRFVEGFYNTISKWLILDV